LTAFYMFRLYFRIFWYEDREYHHTPHESPWTMTVPLMILAVLAVVSGFVFFYILPFGTYITPTGEEFHMHIDWTLAGLSLAVAAVGIIVAYIMYFKKNDKAEKVANAFGAFYKWTYNKFYIDEIYTFVTKKIMFGVISAGWMWFDTNIVDGSMNLIGNTTVKTSYAVKKLQSGRLQDYVLAVVLGIVAIAMIFLYIWTR